ncbi:MAG: hypothetical protein GY765_22120 [bacterium]|nr:hypothetical protein [bacterium]
MDKRLFSFPNFIDDMDPLRRRLFLKMSAAVLLVLFSVVLFQMNRSLAAGNRKMVKFIKNEKTIQAEFELLQTNQEEFGLRTLKVGDTDDAELEKLKSGYIDDLLRISNESNLTVDSYNSEIQQNDSDSFIVFKYNLTIIADFLDVLRFFHRLNKEAPHILVDKYDIKLHMETSTRMGLEIHIVGVP